MLLPIPLVTSAQNSSKRVRFRTSDRAGGSRKRSHTNWQRASASWSAKAASRRKERERPCRANCEGWRKERRCCESGLFREDCAKWDDSAGRKSWESSGCHVQGTQSGSVFGGGFDHFSFLASVKNGIKNGMDIFWQPTEGPGSEPRPMWGNKSGALNHELGLGLGLLRGRCRTMARCIRFGGVAGGLLYVSM